VQVLLLLLLPPVLPVLPVLLAEACPPLLLSGCHSSARSCFQADLYTTTTSANFQ
jgi:hypothetical protein